MSTRNIREASILVVEDEEMNIELMKAYLSEDGYENVTSTRDSRQALHLFETARPDLVLLDLHMPHLSGFTILQQLTAATEADDYLPVIVLTADVNPETKQRALAGGAYDFLTKPLDPVEVQLRIRNVLETRLLYQQQRALRALAEASEQRASFLAEASRILGASFDYHTTLSRLARLAIPDWADYCVVDVLEGESGFTRVGAAHRIPEREPLLRETAQYISASMPRDHPVIQVFDTGAPMLVPGITPTMADLVAASDAHRAAVETLAPHSMVCAPLKVSGRVLGVLSLVTAESGRRYDYEDLVLAEELARRAALALENARLYHEAQQATRARDDILAVVVHDLRNPLNTIQLGVGLLLEELPEGVSEGHLRIVHRSAERMNRLIQDLLEITRIESGKLSLELRDERVGPLLDEAIAMLRPLATARSLELAYDPVVDLPLARMDAARVLQVLSNLVGNAIKFTPAGGRVLIACESTDHEIRFRVADTGPGISAEQIPHIFGRFWQAKKTDHRGIGLGLSIARGIVEAHGGRIWVESRPGEGSTFLFTVPQAQ